jgi:hypothetical protein
MLPSKFCVQSQKRPGSEDDLSPKIEDMPHRQKLSTTIGPDNYAYLRRLVKLGKAASVGEAVDRAVELARRADNRARLERATAEYFNGLHDAAAAEEGVLEAALSDATVGIDFDEQ